MGGRMVANSEATHVIVRWTDGSVSLTGWGFGLLMLVLLAFLFAAALRSGK